MERMQRALISLTDKSGIEDFAGGLAELGIELLSTGGTAAKIRQSGIMVKEISDFTGFPEILDGRVKTLHPLVHGGILNRRGDTKHQDECSRHGIKNIDLVAVNLYAFEEAVSNPGCTLADAVENIDIGGPAMLRAAAKNFHQVTVASDPADYPQILAEIKAYGNTLPKTRFRLAVKAFTLTAGYDTAIYNWLGRIDADQYF
ncbi:MAG: IMP cyclohydrolase [Deltaproteobacteria bacterium]|nr:MAG: IMP cyclohydrolase [Deltaproteobacteria bacterium]